MVAVETLGFLFHTYTALVSNHRSSYVLYTAASKNVNHIVGLVCSSPLSQKPFLVAAGNVFVCLTVNIEFMTPVLILKQAGSRSIRIQSPVLGSGARIPAHVARNSVLPYCLRPFVFCLGILSQLSWFCSPVPLLVDTKRCTVIYTSHSRLTSLYEVT